MTYVICEPSTGVKDRSCVDGDACLPAPPAEGVSESPFAPSEERDTDA